MMGVIRVYDEAANVIGTHKHKGDFQGVVTFFFVAPERPLRLRSAMLLPGARSHEDAP
jgi:hypothetical protein